MITATDNMKPRMWCPGININHPLARGLVLASSLSEGSGSRTSDVSGNGHHGTLIGAGTSWATSPAGPSVFLNNGVGVGVVDFGLDTWTPETAITIIYKQFYTSAGGGGTLGNLAAVSSNACRLGAHLPFTNGTCYWDFGGFDASHRISVAGLSFGEDVWALSAGPQGMYIWQNGILRASNAGLAPTRTRDAALTWGIGRYALTECPVSKPSCILMFDHQLPSHAIQALSRDPQVLFRYNPKTYYRLQNARGFHIYDNAGAGVVDYDTRKAVKPFDVTSYESGALTYPGTWRFGARSFNENGEEKNLTVKKLELDSSGKDATARPNEPASLTATPTAGGKIQLAWTYSSMAEGATPTKFNIYLTAADAIDYSSVHDTETKTTGEVTTYTWESSALTDGTLYTVAVRASTADVEDLNARVLTATADNTAPTQPASITASEDL